VNPYERTRPWASNEERLTTEALSAAVIPGAVLQARVAPPLPRVVAFRPRFGYEQRALGIADIVNLDVLFPGARVDYSGSRSGYSGSSFPALGVM
jgi:hypothetical protein